MQARVARLAAASVAAVPSWSFSDSQTPLDTPHAWIRHGTVIASGSAGRGVCTTGEAKAGDVLMIIPIEICLVHSRNEDEGATDWNFWLALQYVKASNEDSFWRSYRADWLETLAIDTLPFSFEEKGLQSLPSQLTAQTGYLVEQMHKNRKILEDVWYSYSGSNGVPRVLIDANALVLSRCYSIGDDVSAFVPFLDLLNHSSYEPNVEVQVIDGAELQFLKKAVDWHPQNLCTDAAVVVKASEAIPAGTELWSCYAEGAHNTLLALKYGFDDSAALPLLDLNRFIRTSCVLSKPRLDAFMHQDAHTTDGPGAMSSVGVLQALEMSTHICVISEDDVDDGIMGYLNAKMVRCPPISEEIGAVDALLALIANQSELAKKEIDTSPRVACLLPFSDILKRRLDDSHEWLSRYRSYLLWEGSISPQKKKHRSWHQLRQQETTTQP